MEGKNLLFESLVDENSSQKINDLDKLDKLEKIIPKVKGMKEVGECKYHVVNVYEHSIKSLEEFEKILKKQDFFPSHLKERVNDYLDKCIDDNLKRVDLLKLGIFLHDIGKADSKTIDNEGRVHFKGHEVVGSDIAKNLGASFGLNDKSIDTLEKYVRHHMTLLVFYKKNDMSKESINKVFEALNDDCIGVFILGYCDIVATRKLLNPQEDTGVIKTYLEYLLTNYMYRYKRVHR